MNTATILHKQARDLPGERWLAATFAMVVLAMVGTGIWFYHSQQQEVRQDTERNLETIARFKADQIVQWRNERLLDASLLMERMFLKEAINKWTGTPDQVTVKGLRHLLQRDRPYQPYQDAILATPDGQVLLGLSGHRDPLHEEAARTLAIALRDRQPMLSELHAGPGDLPPHLDVIAPIFAERDGEVRAVGAVCLRCDAPNFLYPLIKSWPGRSATAETMLVRRDGDAVLYLNDLRYQQGTALKFRLPLSRKDLPGARAILGDTGIFYGKDYRKIPVVAALTAIPGSTWFIVAKVDMEEAFAAWHFRSVLILALIFGFILAAAMVAGLFWQRKTRLNLALEQRVAERTAHLELALKELETLAYSASHDLRTPLRSIDGFSRILQEDYADKLDDTGRQNLKTIRAASQRMAQLIDDILQLLHIIRAPLRQRPVDLSALAASITNYLINTEPHRRVELVIEPGCVAFADENLMRTVLENLFGNAWKFTGTKPDARIEFGREIHNGILVYFVRDNGVGFDMQCASKLFGPFQRLHKSSEFPGTGIGLASVQRAIHRHGGEVWIEGRLNEGATAYFTIPATIPESEDTT